MKPRHADDQHRDIARRALRRFKLQPENNPAPDEESFSNLMLRLIHLNPDYDSPEAIDWVLRVLQYESVRRPRISAGLDVVLVPDYAQPFLDKLQDDVNKSPPGLSYPQLIEDIRRISPPSPI